MFAEKDDWKGAQENFEKVLGACEKARVEPDTYASLSLADMYYRFFFFFFFFLFVCLFLYFFVCLLLFVFVCLLITQTTTTTDAASVFQRKSKDISTMLSLSTKRFLLLFSLSPFPFFPPSYHHHHSYYHCSNFIIIIILIIIIIFLIIIIIILIIIIIITSFIRC